MLGDLGLDVFYVLVSILTGALEHAKAFVEFTIKLLLSFVHSFYDIIVVFLEGFKTTFSFWAQVFVDIELLNFSLNFSGQFAELRFQIINVFNFEQGLKTVHPAISAGVGGVAGFVS